MDLKPNTTFGEFCSRQPEISAFCLNASNFICTLCKKIVFVGQNEPDSIDECPGNRGGTDLRAIDIFGSLLCTQKYFSKEKKVFSH